MSAEEIRFITTEVGCTGHVEDNEQWIPFNSASDLESFFAACIRSYIQLLPDATAQHAFSSAVVNEYLRTIPSLDDYPKSSEGIHVRQRLVDAHLG